MNDSPLFTKVSSWAAALPPWGSGAPPAWSGFAAACGSVAAVSAGIGLALSHTIISNLSMLYLVPVLLLAAVFGRGPAIFASVLSFLTYDWFFIEPRHAFTIHDPAEWLALTLFLMVAIVCSELAAGVRRRAQEAEQRRQDAQWLHQLSEVLAAPGTAQHHFLAAAEWLVEHFGLAAAAIHVSGGSGMQKAEAYAGLPAATAYLRRTPPESPSVQQVLTAGAFVPGAFPRPRWVRLNRGLARPPAQGVPWEVRSAPLLTGGTRVGALRFARPVGSPSFDPQRNQLLLAVTAQIALAVERERLQAAATEAAALRRADELKTILLDSVSHDLRTPLASIKASAGSLRQKDVQWTEADRDSFAAAIEQETDRLDRLVSHLLDLSRIESGSLQPDKQLYALDALVDDVAARLRPLLAGHTLTVDVPPDLPPVPLDYVQISEVLTNLLENAARHTPPGTPITIAARQCDDAMLVEVTDMGPGIPAEALPRVFDKFSRARRTPRGGAPGSGLGLAVTRGLVEANGGRIWAESAPGKGTRFSFTLPLTEAAATRAAAS